MDDTKNDPTASKDSPCSALKCYCCCHFLDDIHDKYHRRGVTIQRMVDCIGELNEFVKVNRNLRRSLVVLPTILNYSWDNEEYKSEPKWYSDPPGVWVEGDSDEDDGIAFDQRWQVRIHDYPINDLGISKRANVEPEDLLSQLGPTRKTDNVAKTNVDFPRIPRTANEGTFNPKETSITQGSKSKTEFSIARTSLRSDNQRFCFADINYGFRSCSYLMNRNLDRYYLGFSIPSTIPDSRQLRRGHMSRYQVANQVSDKNEFNNNLVNSYNVQDQDDVGQPSSKLCQNIQGSFNNVQDQDDISQASSKLCKKIQDCINDVPVESQSGQIQDQSHLDNNYCDKSRDDFEVEYETDYLESEDEDMDGSSP